MCVCVSSACALAKQVAHKDATDAASYLIKRVYKAGEADRYQVTTRINVVQPNGEPVELVWKLLFKEKIRETNKDGSSTSLSEFESGSLEASGMAIDLTGLLPSMTTVRAKNGAADVRMDGGDPQITEEMKVMM